MTADILQFTGKQYGKQLVSMRVIQFCIRENKSITIGSSNPEQRMKILQAVFPDAKFELVPMGVKLCNQK